jgi:hypothetical protein
MEIVRGKARTEVKLKAERLGEDLLVSICNAGAHIGAVAVGDFDPEQKTVSVSVILRRGHKEDGIAQRAAHVICSRLQRAVCVVAGIHIDRATRGEINQIVRNAASAVRALTEIEGEAQKQ